MAKTLSDAEILERFRVGWREMQRGPAIRRIEARARANRAELDLRQTDALGVIIETGGCRMSDLSERLGMDASNASRTVSRLVGNGYVARTQAPDDGRAVLVSATKAGKEAWNEVNERRTEAVVHVLSRFSDREKIRAAEMLWTIVEGLQEFVEMVEAERN